MMAVTLRAAKPSIGNFTNFVTLKAGPTERLRRVEGNSRPLARGDSEGNNLSQISEER
jgi:hypothetical protein